MNVTHPGAHGTGRLYVMSLVHVQSQLLFGDGGLVAPHRTEEFWLVLVTKTLGLMLIAAVFASLTSKMVSDHRASTRMYKDKVSYLEEWLKTCDVPEKTKAKLRAHLECKYPGGRAFNEHLVLQELSPP